MRNGESQIENVHIQFDGVVYLTDGYASCATVKPYCKLMWLITPDGDDQTVSNTTYPSIVIQLPPYDNR